MEWPEFLEWMVYSGGAFFAYHLINSLRAMNKTLVKLNEKMAVVINNMTWHKETLDDHEDRLKKLEE